LILPLKSYFVLRFLFFVNDNFDGIVKSQKMQIPLIALNKINHLN